jgi:hypothetical protein
VRITLAAEISLVERNHDALSACRDAAERTKKEQRCSDRCPGAVSSPYVVARRRLNRI